jgi:spore coat protein U-like protein
LNKITNKSTVLAMACILILCAGSAFAGTATSNLPVSAVVSANCTVTGGAGLAFGAYDPVVTNAAAPLAGSTNISATCTNGSPATITLSQGANAAGGSTAAAPLRQMTVGGNFLAYSLFQDNANTIVWGDTPATGEAYTGTGVSTTVTVFGLVGAGQNVPAGTYTDTVLITITF